MYRVLIVDDHISMCDSLEYALKEAQDFEVVGRLASAENITRRCAELRPDLVFMDVCTEGGVSGLDGARRIREGFPEIKIIVMSGFDEITYAPRAKEAGAQAFVFKSKSLDDFVAVARAVLRGESHFPQPRLVPLPSGEAPLTAREMEVLRLMCRHMTSREIAEELFISENTVKFHKSNMLAKTGFSRAVDLAFYMITHGWINPLY